MMPLGSLLLSHGLITTLYNSSSKYEEVIFEASKYLAHIYEAMYTGGDNPMIG